MRYLILFCLCVSVPFTARAEEAEPKIQASIKALLEYCLPALTNGIAPDDFAVQEKLPALPADAALKFAPDGGGVFAIPYAQGNAVLIARKNVSGVCSVAVKKTTAEEFWKTADHWFGAKSPFKLKREKRHEADKVTKREYTGDLNGPVMLLITVSDVPRQNGMQALMTVARVKK